MQPAEFVKRVQQAGGLDTVEEAERWTLEVLTALCDLDLPRKERRNFVAQLPGLFKARLSDEPPRGLVMDREAFVQHVAARLGTRAPDADRAIRAVWSVVTQAVSAGQTAAFVARLPKDLAALLRGPAAAPQRTRA